MSCWHYHFNQIYITLSLNKKERGRKVWLIWKAEKENFSSFFLWFLRNENMAGKGGDVEGEIAWFVVDCWWLIVDSGYQLLLSYNNSKHQRGNRRLRVDMGWHLGYLHSMQAWKASYQDINHHQRNQYVQVGLNLQQGFVQRITSTLGYWPCYQRSRK